MAFDKTVAETIETMTDSLRDSTLLSDRRDACRGLRSLSKDYRVEVGAQAMDALLQAIRNDSHDSEIVNYCLESLNYIISGSLADSPAATWPDSADQTGLGFDQSGTSSNSFSSSNRKQTTAASTAIAKTTTNHHHSNNNGANNRHGSSGAGSLKHDPGRELAEIFLKKHDHVHTILDFVTDNDFKTRWVAVRLICGLARHKLAMVQDYILSFPTGVSRLMQLIAEEQELIRNDALVLFVRMTQSNSSLQHIVAYENGFDKIMYIIELENYLDGTVAVVMDCLNILLNLTQTNEPNQILFREAGHIQKLMPFFNAIPTIQWTNEKTACLVLVLQIIDSMILPTNSSVHVQTCQNIMQRCGLLDKLCELLTATSMPIGVLSETMNTASDIVRGHLGPNANMVMPTQAMMPVMLLSMVKEICQNQEQKIVEIYDYMHKLHEYVTCSK